MKTHPKHVLRQGFLIVLLFLFAAVAAYSGAKFVSEYLQFSRAKNYYDTVRAAAVPASDENAASDPAAESAGAPADAPSGVDFEALQKLNGDVVAWIRAPGTPIDYPVAQGTDNNFYLRHLLDKSYSIAGTVFMDCRNAADMTDDNTVFYGHNMKYDDTMFSTLTKYREQSYYDAHPELELDTPQGEYRIRVFAGRLATSDTELVLNFADDGEKADFIRTEIGRSDFSADFTPGADDRIVTLATCSFAFEDARYLLFGVLVSK